MLLVTFILTLSSFFFTNGLAMDSYCTRAAGIVNITGDGTECFLSSLSNVTNCCFRCRTNTYVQQKCGSLYNFGLTSCNLNANDYARVSSACLGNGTVGSDGNFQCYCNTGTDNSQLYNTATTNGGILDKTGMSIGSGLIFLLIVTFFV